MLKALLQFIRVTIGAITPEIGVMAQTKVDIKSMGIYLKYKKIRSRSQKFRPWREYENDHQNPGKPLSLRKYKFQKNSPEQTKLSLAQ